MASRVCLFPPIMPMHLPLITVNNDRLLVCCSKYYKGSSAAFRKTWAEPRKQLVFLLLRHLNNRAQWRGTPKRPDTFIPEHKVCYVCLCVLHFKETASSSAELNHNGAEDMHKLSLNSFGQLYLNTAMQAGKRAASLSLLESSRTRCFMCAHVLRHKPSFPSQDFERRVQMATKILSSANRLGFNRVETVNFRAQRIDLLRNSPSTLPAVIWAVTTLRCTSVSNRTDPMIKRSPIRWE